MSTKVIFKYLKMKKGNFVDMIFLNNCLARLNNLTVFYDVLKFEQFYILTNAFCNEITTNCS